MKIIVKFLCTILALTTVFVSTSYATDDMNDDETIDILLIDEYRHEVSSLSLNQNNIMRSLTYDYVDTPNGTNIPVYLFTCTHPESYVETQNTRWDDFFPEATRWSSADCTYNCHSYAWYSQDVEENQYWMDDPSMYYQDNSYIEVSTPRKGDIICYFDENGTESELDDINLHSGIVLEYDPSISINNICGIANQILVLSKWGQVGLYEHKGDYCPYTSNYGGDADYVKFYRPRTNVASNLTTNMRPVISNIILSNIGIITDKYYMYELNVETAGKYDIWVTSNINLDERFYDENMNLCLYSAVYPNQTNTHHYYVNLMQGRYYFRVENVDEDASATAKIVISSHSTHNYQYVNNNNAFHTAVCACGNTVTALHSYSCKPLNDRYHILMCECGKTSGEQSLHTLKFDSGDENYKQCIACGILVNIGGTEIYPIQSNKNPQIEERGLY